MAQNKSFTFFISDSSHGLVAVFEHESRIKRTYFVTEGRQAITNRIRQRVKFDHTDNRDSDSLVH